MLIETVRSYMMESDDIIENRVLLLLLHLKGFTVLHFFWCLVLCHVKCVHNRGNRHHDAKDQVWKDTKDREKDGSVYARHDEADNKENRLEEH